MSNFACSTPRSCTHCPIRWPIRVGRVLVFLAALKGFVGGFALAVGMKSNELILARGIPGPVNKPRKKQDPHFEEAA